MINEFSGRNYACKSDDLVPSYGTLAAQSQVCNAVGAVAGRDYVEGEAYINSAYSYYRSHKWRNIGIMFAFMVGFLTVYLVASENIRAKKSKGEVLLFQKGRIPAALKEKSQDEEMSEVNRVSSVMSRQMSNVEATDVILRQTAVFSWRNVCYDIKIKGEERRILDNVGMLGTTFHSVSYQADSFNRWVGQTRYPHCANGRFWRWQNNTSRRPSHPCHDGRYQRRNASRRPRT